MISWNRFLLALLLVALTKFEGASCLAPAYPRNAGNPVEATAISRKSAQPKEAARARVNIEVSVANLPKDLERIRVCRLSAFSHRKHIDGEPQLLKSERSFVNAEQATDSRSVCLVAKEMEAPHHILGTADLKLRDNGSVLLNNVFVMPQARGQGIAQKLVQEAELVASEMSNEIWLAVDTSNTPAVSLYQKRSYRTTGVHSVLHALARMTGFNLRMNMSKELSVTSS